MEFVLDKSNYTLPNYHQPITRTPYPFQKKAFEALDKIKANNPKGFSSMLVLPTGAGKTFTAVHWVIKNYVNENVKVLWVAHRSELLRQAAETFFINTTTETLPDRSHFYSYVISSEFGRSCNISDGSEKDVVIASRQSICSSSNMRYFIKWAKGRGLKHRRRLLIVLDEAHHAAASSYRTIIKTMKKYVPHVDILGLTATPYRTAKNEQGSLKSIFSTGSGIAYSIDMNTLISCGVLATPKHIEISTDVDMTQLFDSNELRRISKLDITSLNEKSLEKINKNTQRNQMIVDTYLANKKEFGQTIVFAVDVLNAVALNAIFQSQGVKSDFVISSVAVGMNRSASTEINPKIIQAFKAGELEVLINVNIVTEGTDIPNIKTVFIARPTTSKILMTQMVGRGLRGEAAGGTKETNIVYFMDNWKGLVDFVSPKALFEGEDVVAINKSDRKKVLKYYIDVSEISEYAVSGYVKTTNSFLKYNNIIPYGTLQCNYICEDENGNENEIKKDIVVFDEAVEIYEKILSDVSKISDETVVTEEEIKLLSSEIFFKYCEITNGAYIGVSSDGIEDIIRTFLTTKAIPNISKIEDRVSLYDIMKSIYSPDAKEKEIVKQINEVFETNPRVRSWYDREMYDGLMQVYWNRLKKVSLNEPEFVLPPKEKMDMGELKKHYPSYYEELRNYLILNMKRDEEGYYYSALQEEGQPPIRSKHLRSFEIDHIKPISKGGLTVKENLQMITRVQNMKKGNKI